MNREATKRVRSWLPALACLGLAAAGLLKQGAVPDAEARTAAGGSTRAEDADPMVVARVGDARLTEAELALLVGGPTGDAGDPATAERCRSEAIQAWVSEETLYREALRLGLDRTDPVVRRRLAILMYENEVVSRTFSDELGPEEVRAFYDGHPEKFRRPAETFGYHVVLRFPAGTATASRQAVAERVREAAGEGPEALNAALRAAEQVGTEVRVPYAVDAPWTRAALEKGFGPEVAAAGESSEALAGGVIVVVGDAVHVLRATARIDESQRPFEAVAAVAERELRGRRCRERYRSLMQDLVRRHDVESSVQCPWEDPGDAK